MTRGEAKALVAALVSLRESAADKDASAAAAAYPRLKGGGALIRAGTRINVDGMISGTMRNLPRMPHQTSGNGWTTRTDTGTFPIRSRSRPRLRRANVAGGRTASCTKAFTTDRTYGHPPHTLRRGK